MSLDISLTNKTTDEVVADMNWLRNPFGLCNWAEDNVNVKTKRSLWYVINHWNYGKSHRVNRPLFKQVVDEYWQAIEPLEKGYFFFNIASYMSFVQPHLDVLPVTNQFHQPRIEGGIFKGHKYGIPIELFDKPCFNLGYSSLESYKEWFRQLVEFAELLQDKSNRFYCSN